MRGELGTVSTDRAPAAIGPYSQAKTAGGFLFASGQIAIDPATGEMNGNDIKTQAAQVMANVGAILDEAGLTEADVVRTCCYLADINDFAAFNEVYGEFFKSKPARSCVAVRSLPKGALCEVEITAFAG